MPRALARWCDVAGLAQNWRVPWEHGTSSVKTQRVLDKPGHWSSWMWDVGGFRQGLACTVFRDLYAAWFWAWLGKPEHWPAFLCGAATDLSTIPSPRLSLRPLAPSFCVSQPLPSRSSERSRRPGSSPLPPQCIWICGESILRTIFPRSFLFRICTTSLIPGEREFSSKHHLSSFSWMKVNVLSNFLGPLPLHETHSCI